MNNQIIDIVKDLSITKDEKICLLAFIDVETGGEGFDKSTGKILIQFEPAWFKKFSPYAPSGKWSVNKVEVQRKEWIAFNDAFAKDKEAAMKSTSIGLGQIMGFHYKALGFKQVGDMWDNAKVGLANQVKQMLSFIRSNKQLEKAMLSHNWHLCAYYYNGAEYKAMAKKWGREPYNVSLEKAYNKWAKFLL